MTTMFNSKYLRIRTELKQDDVLLQTVDYTYNDKELSIRIERKNFDSHTDTAFCVITAAEYDSKGNTTASWSAQAKGSTADTPIRRSVWNMRRSTCRATLS